MGERANPAAGTGARAVPAKATKPSAGKKPAPKPKASAKGRKRWGGGMGLVLLAFIVAAGLMYLAGGVKPRRGTPGAEAEIAANRARLTELALREPIDLNAELKRLRREELKARNGILVDDLEAEKQKILAMTDADWNAADIAR